MPAILVPTPVIYINLREPRAPKMMKAILEDVGSSKVTLTNIKEKVVAALGQKASEAVLESLTGEPCR